MTETELIDALFADLETCIGLSLEQRRKHLFPHFAKENAAKLTGDAICQSVRSRHPVRYGRIRELVNAVCVQWDDWRYAVQHWPESARKDVPGARNKPC